MALFEIPTKVSDRQIRQFALLCLALLPTLAWYWNASTTWLAATASLGAALVILAFFSPQVVAPLYLLLIYSTAPFGWVIGEIAMLTIYVFVFCPIGLLFRLRKRDSLHLNEEATSQSYWLEKTTTSETESYYKLY